MDTSLPVTLFRLRGIGDYIELTAEHIFNGPDDIPWHGYGAKGTLDIRVGNYAATAKHYFQTGELADFCTQLERCYESLNGEAVLENAENMLKLRCAVNRRGHVMVTGSFREHPTSENCLHFEIATDQTQLAETIETLKRFGEAVCPTAL